MPLLALTLSVLLLAGCATLGDAPPPESVVELPERFAAAEGEPLPDRWWLHFDDPRLDRLVTTALSDNFSLRAARERLEAARAAARRDGAARQPSLNGNLSARSERDDGGERGESYRAGASAAYELDLWGRVAATTDAARFDAEATRADLEAAAITLSAETASTYYQLLQQRGVRALLAVQLGNNRQVLELVELRYRNGAASADEVLRQEQLIEQTEGSVIEADAELELLRHRLAVLTGRAGRELELPEQTGAIAVPPLPEAGLPAEWLRRRPDLRRAFYQLQAADARAAAAVAAQYPRFDLSGSVESAAASPSNLFGNWLAALTANLTAPLFDGGQRRAEAERSQASRAAALQEYGQAVLEAAQEVESALTTEQRDRRLVASLEQRAARAERIVDQLQNRYLNGSVNYIEVLEALDSQQQLQRQLLAARWALVQDRITLARALAGGWDAENQSAPLIDARLEAE